MDTQRLKERLSKNAKRQVETQEDSAQRRKIDRHRKMRKRQTETDEQSAQRMTINCECMKRKRLFETQEESDQRKKTMRECKMRQRQTETLEQGAKRKKTMLDRNTRKRQTETEEQGAKRKKTMQRCVTRMREERRHQSENDRRDCNGEDMSNVIDRAKKEAKQFLHRTRDPANPKMQRATVCIICDRFIIGTETIHKLTKEDIGAHSERLGVKSYKEYYQTTLKAKVKRQYQVQGLTDMLLSP